MYCVCACGVFVACVFGVCVVCGVCVRILCAVCGATAGSILLLYSPSLLSPIPSARSHCYFPRVPVLWNFFVFYCS